MALPDEELQSAASTRLSSVLEIEGMDCSSRRGVRIGKEAEISRGET